MRALVADSWRRSARSGVDPEVPAPPVDLTGRQLTGYRREHPLAAAMPTVRELLVRPGSDAGWVTALTDSAGRLLWVEGAREVRRGVETAGFVEGALWREDCAGTSAPGIALATDRAVQVLGSEHFARSVQPWNCTAAPVHGADGRVLGILDVTGGPSVAGPLALGLVRATVAAVEAELALHAAARTGWPAPAASSRGDARPSGGPQTTTDAPRLRVLGSSAPTVRVGGVEIRLSLRHAEILLLLAAHPAGLTGEELAVLLSDDTLSDVTVRAEISRLRRVAGPLLAPSHPYRLAGPVRADADLVRERLAVGDLDGALSCYPGPLLARSAAPGVERAREELQAELRAAVLAAHEPGPISRWVAADAGAEDWQAWQRLAALERPGSPARTRADARLDLLGRRLQG
ncbi:GAF domain-containing protein [Cellulomonas soli]